MCSKGKGGKVPSYCDPSQQCASEKNTYVCLRKQYSQQYERCVRTYDIFRAIEIVFVKMTGDNISKFVVAL
jgi:hypothetical protein